MPSNNDSLLMEANKISYRLRSTFFYRKLHEYQTLEFPGIVQQLIPHADNFNWEDYRDWGISEHAYTLIANSELELIQVFCHPRLLREIPQLTAYYRNVAVLSQKSVNYLAQVNPKKFEEEQEAEISETVAFKLTRLFNEHISLILDSALGEFDELTLHGLLFASTGTQIDGSWRNAIGDEAEKVVQRLLIQEVLRLNVAEAFIKKADNSIMTLENSKTKDILDNIGEFKGVMLTTQKSILFSSEPDISIIDKNGETLLVIEVKGGKDPAGALERYGAAKKSLGESMRENPKVKTCFLASCITDEVKVRIERDPTILRYINLTEVITQDEKKEEFIRYVFDMILS